MLVNPFAKYSGKGTPMISRRGKSTICLYACFKQALSEGEMKATGLKPQMDEELIERLKEKDRYATVQPRVFSQTGDTTGGSSKLQEIRERIKLQYGTGQSTLSAGGGLQ